MAQGFTGISNIRLGANQLINGQMAVAQRQIDSETTLTTYSDDEYCTADRWYILTQSNDIDTALATGDVCNNSLQLKQTNASAQRMGVAQILESVDSIPMQGQNMRLNGRFKISTDQDVRYAILSWTGTADSVTSDVVADWTSGTYTAGNFFLASNLSVDAVGESASPGTGWVDFNLDATISSSCNNLIVMVWTEGTAAQNLTLDVEAMDLHLGQSDRTFDPRPIAEELYLCKRYFEARARTGSFAPMCHIGIATSTSGGVAFLYYDVVKRAAPTMTISDAGDFKAYDGAANATLNTFTFDRITPYGCRSIPVASGTPLTQYRPLQVQTNTAATGDSRIFMDAEL